MKRIKFYTFGCKTNQYETQAMRESLICLQEYSEATPGEKADIYIVNTCTVTSKADRNSRRQIRNCKRENPNSKVVLTGCLAQLNDDAKELSEDVEFVVRNNEKSRIRDILANPDTIKVPDKKRELYTPLKISDFQNKTKAFVKVQDGCDNYCSYCKIPLVRGRSRSREMEDILQEVVRLKTKGFKELVLTGICLGDWGRTLKKRLSLSDLLREIDGIEGDFRVRLSSIEPNMVTGDLIKVMQASKKICRHLHIPLQSGSDKILKLMNRPYTSGDYKFLIKKIKKAIPGISITSDVIVGFPGETRDDFKKTISLIRHIMPSRLHIFTYSARVGTNASRLNGRICPDELKKRRITLEELAKRTSYKYRRRFLKNKSVEALIETTKDPDTNMLTGYTDTYVRFLLNGPDNLMGCLTNIKVRKLDIKSTFCEY